MEVLVFLRATWGSSRSIMLVSVLLEADFFVWFWGAEASVCVFVLVLVAFAVDGGAPFFLSSDDSSFVLLSEPPLAAGRSPNKPPYMVKE
jgi:hypothetical protein